MSEELEELILSCATYDLDNIVAVVGKLTNAEPPVESTIIKTDDTGSDIIEVLLESVLNSTLLNELRTAFENSGDNINKTETLCEFIQNELGYLEQSTDEIAELAKAGSATKTYDEKQSDSPTQDLCKDNQANAECGHCLKMIQTCLFLIYCRAIVYHQGKFDAWWMKNPYKIEILTNKNISHESFECLETIKGRVDGEDDNYYLIVVSKIVNAMISHKIRLITRSFENVNLKTKELLVVKQCIVSQFNYLVEFEYLIKQQENRSRDGSSNQSINDIELMIGDLSEIIVNNSSNVVNRIKNLSFGNQEMKEKYEISSLEQSLSDTLEFESKQEENKNKNKVNDQFFETYALLINKDQSHMTAKMIFALLGLIEPLNDSQTGKRIEDNSGSNNEADLKHTSERLKDYQNQSGLQLYGNNIDLYYVLIEILYDFAVFLPKLDSFASKKSNNSNGGNNFILALKYQINWDCIEYICNNGLLLLYYLLNTHFPDLDEKTKSYHREQEQFRRKLESFQFDLKLKDILTKLSFISRFNYSFSNEAILMRNIFLVTCHTILSKTLNWNFTKQFDTNIRLNNKNNNAAIIIKNCLKHNNHNHNHNNIINNINNVTKFGSKYKSISSNESILLCDANDKIRLLYSRLMNELILYYWHRCYLLFLSFVFDNRASNMMHDLIFLFDKQAQAHQPQQGNIGPNESRLIIINKDIGPKWKFFDETFWLAWLQLFQSITQSPPVRNNNNVRLSIANDLLTDFQQWKKNGTKTLENSPLLYIAHMAAIAGVLTQIEAQRLQAQNGKIVDFKFDWNGFELEMERIKRHFEKELYGNRLLGIDFGKESRNYFNGILIIINSFIICQCYDSIGGRNGLAVSIDKKLVQFVGSKNNRNSSYTRLNWIEFLFCYLQDSMNNIVECSHGNDSGNINTAVSKRYLQFLPNVSKAVSILMQIDYYMNMEFSSHPNIG